MIDGITSWIDGTYNLLYLGVAGLLILTVAGYVFRRYWIVFKGTKAKMPAWLERLYLSSQSITSVPRWLIKVFFYLPGKFIETLLDTLIVLAGKLRSRPALVVLALFTAIFTIILKPSADFNLLIGLSGVIASSSFILIKFMDITDKEKDRKYGRSMEQEKIVGDVKKEKAEDDKDK